MGKRRGQIGLVWLLLCLSLFGCSQPETPTVVGPIQPLIVVAPEVVDAGDPLRVAVHGQGLQDGALVYVTTSGSYGGKVFFGEANDETAIVLISAESTQLSGHTTIIATAEGYRGTTAVEILPDDPIEPLTPLVGARSIVADGEHWSMTVVVPFDQYNNPVATGTELTVRAQHPDGVLEVLETETEHLLAWERIYSRTKAGRTPISVTTRRQGETTDTVFGSEATLLEIPGWPVPFSLLSDRNNVAADGRQLVTIETEVIVDKYDNVMPDGTAVMFIIDSKDGRRMLPSSTIDGSAETNIQAPSDAQQFAVSAVIHDVESDKLLINFGANTQPFELSATYQPSTTAIYVEAGPILGTLEQYIPDGTVAEIKLRQDRTVVYRGSGIVDAGYLRHFIYLTSAQPGTFDVVVTVSGQQVSAEITITE